ncbi:MAG: type II toxin-antitoxin system RelE/ParE family toxin [Planctomycetota bacterium]
MRQFEALEAAAKARISDAIDDLAGNPRPAGAKKLAGTTGYRVRTGDWRILYTVDDPVRLVRVYRIGNRRDAHRNL